MNAIATSASGSLAALGQRPPRLVLRVILYSALTLGIGGATLLVFIRHYERVRADHTAMLESVVVTQGVVDHLKPADVDVPLTAARRRQLDRLFRARVLDSQTLGAAIVAADRRTVYSTESSTTPVTAPSAQLAKALDGTVAAKVLTTRFDGASRRVLRTYAPFRLGDGTTGVMEIDKDFGAIASDARQGAIAVAAILELMLLVLWLCLIPIMRAATRRIHRQLDTIAHLALHDDLTGLANRAQLGARLDDLVADDEKAELAVLFIDLDRFKEVNDTLGHDRGNELLREISKRITGALGPGDLVARLGGDEFAIVSERTTDAAAALELARTLQAVIAELFEIAGVSIEPQASIGIALAPEHGTTRDELLRRADIAMYAAKRRGAPQVFTPDLDDHSRVRLALTGELRRALERGELGVRYQPQFDLREGRVRGVEALVRWHHPTRGLLEPGDFLDAVEHAGLMRRLTGSVLGESLRQLREWHADGLDLVLAVNVSARDLADTRFREELASALARHEIEPSSLELEITENVLLSESVRASNRLEKIVGLGVRVAIDDFGVGYSSLGQLKNVPAHVLKIDQSFVTGMAHDPRDAAIVDSTIELAHNLGLEVVAEGVETVELALRLRDMGCDLVQGYLLGRPLPVSGRGDHARLVAADPFAAEVRDNVVPLRRASA